MAIPQRYFSILRCSAANSPSFPTSHLYLSAIFFCLHFVGGNALSSFPLSSLEGGAEANNILRPLTKHRQNGTEVFPLPERKQNPYPFRRSRPSPPPPLSPRKKSRATTQHNSEAKASQHAIIISSLAGCSQHDLYPTEEERPLLFPSFRRLLTLHG